jgi:hypothetical protein
MWQSDITSTNFGRSRKIQVLSELVLQFSALSFCSSEREEKRKKEKGGGQEKPLSRWSSVVVGMAEPRLLGCFVLLKKKS